MFQFLRKAVSLHVWLHCFGQRERQSGMPLVCGTTGRIWRGEIRTSIFPYALSLHRTCMCYWKQEWVSRRSTVRRRWVPPVPQGTVAWVRGSVQGNSSSSNLPHIHRQVLSSTVLSGECSPSEEELLPLTKGLSFEANLWHIFGSLSGWTSPVRPRPLGIN